MKVKVNSVNLTQKILCSFFCYFWTVVNPKKTKKRKLENYGPNLVKKKKKLPSEFIEHILSLGFNRDDADRLYEEKDNWTGVSSGGKLFCTKSSCKFYTKIASDELFEHCRVEHQWTGYKCSEENCNFVAYSNTALNQHASFHSIPPNTHNEYNCSIPTCRATFSRRYYKQMHENVHNNIQLKESWAFYLFEKLVFTLFFKMLKILMEHVTSTD